MTMQFRTIDFERLILVPVFSGIFVLNTVMTIRFVKSMDLSSLSILLALNELFSLIFIAMIIFLFFSRRHATAGTDEFMPNFLAYVGTFLMMSTVFIRGEVHLAPLIVAAFLMVTGMLFSIYSLKTLGRNFGIRPEARSLVRSGPYRFIRHPLYVGEFIVMAGGFLVGFSALKIPVFLLWVCIQAYRAGQEERVLEKSIPEYSLYKLETKRFIPGFL